jgi:hypothetical protein
MIKNFQLRYFLWIFCFLLISEAGTAQPRVRPDIDNTLVKKKRVKRKAKSTKEEFGFQSFNSTWDLQTGLDHRDFTLVPNALLKDQNGLVTETLFASAYADLKWKGDYWQFVARPMALVQQQNNRFYQKKDQTKSILKSQGEFKELYAVWIPDGDVSFTFGRQKYEWGPTEFYNVTNPFVTDVSYDAFARSIDLGYVLLRSSYSFARTWNFTALMDFDDTTEVRESTRRTDDQSYVLKIENSSLEGDYLYGLVQGKGNINAPFVGAYGRWSHDSGFSIYFDAKDSQGSPSYYPINRGTNAFPAVELVDRFFNQKERFGVGLLGIRWENEWDLRLEYLKNDSGYDQAQWDLFPYAFAPNNYFYIRNNLQALSQIHMPFFRKNYLYSSGRSPEFGPQKSFQFVYNFVQNLDDRSMLGVFKVEQEVGDSGTLIYLFTNTRGDRDNGEFSSYLNNFISIIFKWII